MKRILLATGLCFAYTILFSQSTWTWLQGDRYSPLYGIYGVKGVAAPDNRPGDRTDETSWKDNNGNIWLFGGNGISSGGRGVLNDLWKFEPSTGTWTWMTGDQVENLPGIYGQKGVPSASNRVPARSNAVSWTDAAGNFWLYGGTSVVIIVQFSVPFSYSTTLNDLWKYSPATGLWAWMGGDTLYKTMFMYQPVYGQKGIPAATNYPGSRSNAQSWRDAAGDFWLFGGYGKDSRNFAGIMNDLWKFSTASQQWTWITGDTTVQSQAVYGTKGVEAASNKPGPTSSATNWQDAAGNTFIFGGQTGVSGGFTNDLWRYSVATGQWTWIGGAGPNINFDNIQVYGTRGVPSTQNIPRARAGSMGVIEASGSFLLYGGTMNQSLVFNDLWRYNPTTLEWTWLSGDQGLNEGKPVYGPLNVATDSTKPAGGLFRTTWTDQSNNLWIRAANQLFIYGLSTDKWKWVKGDTVKTQYLNPSYGSKGTASATNTPGSRQYGATWRDSEGNLLLFGGFNVYNVPVISTQSPKNDLWKYIKSTNQWTWIGGDSAVLAKYSYGQKGISAPSNLPPPRQRALFWSDNNGDAWLFGGLTQQGATSGYADLWKFSVSTGMWTWVMGDTSNTSTGVYGTLGVASATNKPGARFSGTTWVDKAGNLWMYGGNYGGAVRYYDLWKYTISTGWWTWMGGDSRVLMFTPYFTPSYGQKGVPHTGAQPGGRSDAMSWTDTAGNFWMFGGAAFLSYISRSYNDLWKYSLSEGWVWMGGDNVPNQRGIYGTQGVASVLNIPAARNAAVTWSDASGNLYLFGGNADTVTGNYPMAIRYYNDLWKYSVANNTWTWLAGDSIPGNNGKYGTMGIASSSNEPGARTGTMGWPDGAGRLWMYGGYGYPESGFRYLNDMMLFEPQSALPVLFSNFTAQQQNKSALLHWSTAQEFNSRLFSIERSSNGVRYTSIGTLNAAGNSSLTSDYYFTDNAPLEGDNFYRIKETDADGSFIYSRVKQVTFGLQNARFDIVNNPVARDVQLNFVLPVAQNVTVQLLDINGQLLLTRQYPAGKGTTLISLPAARLAGGSYLVSVKSESLNETKMFLKQ